MMNLIIILSLLVAKLSIFSSFLVEGPSMQPTLRNGDIFILNKDAYATSRPKRGDIVVFFKGDDPDYLYVKRVIGLPGERLHVTSTGIYLEDGIKKKFLVEPYLAADDGAAKVMMKGYTDELFIVPKDKYFVMGDNRGHSFDSRLFLDPFVPKEDIKGKYIFTLLSK